MIPTNSAQMSQPVENPKFCVAKSKFVLFFYTT